MIQSSVHTGHCSITFEGWICCTYILAEKTLRGLSIRIRFSSKIDVIEYHWFWPKSLQWHRLSLFYCRHSDSSLEDNFAGDLIGESMDKF